MVDCLVEPAHPGLHVREGEPRLGDLRVLQADGERPLEEVSRLWERFLPVLLDDLEGLKQEAALAAGGDHKEVAEGPGERYGPKPADRGGHRPAATATAVAAAIAVTAGLPALVAGRAGTLASAPGLVRPLARAVVLGGGLGDRAGRGHHERREGGRECAPDPHVTSFAPVTTAPSFPGRGWVPSSPRAQ